MDSIRFKRSADRPESSGVAVGSEAAKAGIAAARMDIRIVVRIENEIITSNTLESEDA